MIYVYVIRDTTNNLYIGISQNPEQRLLDHNSHRGAQFTKTSSDFSTVFLEKYPTLSAARTREIQLKKWSRVKKEKLIEMYKKGIDTQI